MLMRGLAIVLLTASLGACAAKAQVLTEEIGRAHV